MLLAYVAYLIVENCNIAQIIAMLSVNRGDIVPQAHGQRKRQPDVRVGGFWALTFSRGRWTPLGPKQVNQM